MRVEKRLALYLRTEDNVATLLNQAQPGEEVTVTGPTGTEIGALEAAEPIPRGHKIALEDIPDGTNIYKYGEVIGRATSEIRAGTWVHVHNLESLRGRGDRDE